MLALSRVNLQNALSHRAADGQNELVSGIIRDNEKQGLSFCIWATMLCPAQHVCDSKTLATVEFHMFGLAANQTVVDQQQNPSQ